MVRRLLRSWLFWPAVASLVACLAWPFVLPLPRYVAYGTPWERVAPDIYNWILWTSAASATCGLFVRVSGARRSPRAGWLVGGTLSGGLFGYVDSLQAYNWILGCHQILPYVQATLEETVLGALVGLGLGVLADICVSWRSAQRVP